MAIGAFQAVLLVKNPPANGGNITDYDFIPGSGRSPGGGHSNPLQYSCLENPMDRGSWQATVHRVTKSRAQLKQLSTHTRICSVTQSCPTLWDPTDRSMPDFPVLHLLELAQTHVHWLGDPIQPSHSLSSPSPPAFNFSQHQHLL